MKYCVTTIAFALTLAGTTRAVDVADIQAAIVASETRAQDAPAPAAPDAPVSEAGAQAGSAGPPARRVHDTLSAGQQPTPWPGVAAMLNALQPKPDEVLLDPGCGYDARLLIAACNYYGVERAIGVEIDPESAASARRHVEDAGLSDRIEIITGDSTKLDIEADIAVAYMWPEFLAAFRPKIEKLDRFVSYGFAVPGLPLTTLTLAGGGHVYSWKKPPAVTRVPVTQSVRKTVRLPRGSYCSVCGRHCSNPMQHMLQQQIVGYRTVAAPDAQRPAAAPSGHWQTVKVCRNGRCSYERRWIPN